MICEIRFYWLLCDVHSSRMDQLLHSQVPQLRAPFSCWVMFDIIGSRSKELKSCSVLQASKEPDVCGQPRVTSQDLLLTPWLWSCSSAPKSDPLFAAGSPASTTASPIIQLQCFTTVQLIVIPLLVDLCRPFAQSATWMSSNCLLF